MIYRGKNNWDGDETVGSCNGHTQDLGGDVTKIDTKFSITHAQTFHVGKDYISEAITNYGVNVASESYILWIFPNYVLVTLEEPHQLTF
jgi:hypothetical protein